MEEKCTWWDRDLKNVEEWQQETCEEYGRCCKKCGELQLEGNNDEVDHA